MAIGADAYAHSVALRKGGFTIAVLGNGIDICYPKEHDSLMQHIAECGLLLSQFSLGTGSSSYNFPIRNRVIAALSDPLYIVAARKNSGSIITGREALRLNHKVYALVSDDSNDYYGCRILCNEGAESLT